MTEATFHRRRRTARVQARHDALMRALFVARWHRDRALPPHIARLIAVETAE